MRAPVLSGPEAAAHSIHSTWPAILVIDDDVGTRETLHWALSHCGYSVMTAATGTDAIRIAQAGPPDLMLIDLRLPDIPGVDVVRTLQQQAFKVPFVLFSAFLTTAVTVDAMRLGAIDVLEKPIDIDDVVAVVCSAVVAPPRSPAAIGEPKSAAERWASYVMKACDSDGDLKTIAEWARIAGVSYSSLRESCRLLGIRPRDARDFVRVLRVLLRSTHRDGEIAALLDISDHRTLAALLRRAALNGTSRHGLSIGHFIRSQAFVHRDNEGLAAIARLLPSAAQAAP